MLHGGSRWSKIDPSLWSGVSGVCGRNGKCEMGCDFTWWFYGVRGNRNIHQLKSNMSCCSG